VPRRYSSAEVIKGLEREGFTLVSQRGSHAKYRKPGQPTLTVIVPTGRREIPAGTLRSILRQAALDESAFKRR
jgi:predicted RNA binding protein YcfA (HicA-like mRNA interferase family)